MTQRVRVIGLGAGGHCAVMLELLQALGAYEVVALLDPREALWGSSVHGVPVIGGDDLLRRQYDAGVTSAFLGLGGSSDNGPRRRLYELARSNGFDVVTAVHPSSIVSPSAKIAAGSNLFASSVVNADVDLGENVLVNTGAIIEHGCRVGAHVHVATGARIASGVTVGDEAHIGLGAVVRQGIDVGRGAVVAAGAAVVRDVEDWSVVGGVPARPLRSRKP